MSPVGSVRLAVALPLLFGILFFATLDNQLLIPLLPEVALDVSVPAARLAGLFSAYALAAALVNILIAPLTDRRRRERFVAMGLVLLTVSGVGILTADGYWLVLVCRLFAGLGGGLLSLCTAALVGDWFSYERRGKAMGIVLSAYFAALIFGIHLSVAVAQRWGWRAGFSVIACACLLLLLGLWRFLARGGVVRKRASPGPTAQGMGMLGVYRGFLGSGATLGAVVTSFLTSGATMAFLAFLSGLGLGSSRIAMLFMVTGAASMAGAPLSGLISDWASKRQVFLVSNSLLIVPLLGVGYAEWGSTLFVSFFALMLLAAARQTTLQTIQTELAGSRNRGAFLGLRNAFSQLGISSSVFAAGILFQGGGFWNVILLSSTLTALASLVFWRTVPEPDWQK